MIRSANVVCLALCALIAAPLTSSALAATVNSSDVQLNITYSFAGAVFTDTGLPAVAGADYEFDGPPSTSTTCSRHSYSPEETAQVHKRAWRPWEAKRTLTRTTRMISSASIPTQTM